jgi:hypothetical protein
VPQEQYYAFVDESELGDEANYIARAGFVLAQNQLERLGASFEGILREYDVPRHDPKVDCEVKYDPPKTNYFHGVPDRHLLYARLTSLLGAHGATALGIVIARDRVRKWSRREARVRALTYLMERVEVCLRGVGGSGCVFLDKSSHGGEDERPVVLATRLIRSGSDYDFRFTRISPEPRELNSREWCVIQLADLVVGVTARKVREHILRQRGEIPSSTPDNAYAAAIWEPLRGRFMSLPGTDVKRFGLRIFPSGYESGFAAAHQPYPS